MLRIKIYKQTIILMKETELAEKFINFFDDNFTIYCEVPANGFIDFVVVNGLVTIAVEVKTSLNFNVIEQAYKNINLFHYSYIAVPKPKNLHFGYEICRKLGIGVLTYTEEYIEEKIKPNFNRKALYKFVRLEDYMKRSVAGSQNDRITPFKATIENMVKYIKRHPGCLLKDCLENIDYHWSNITSAKGCVYQWLQKGVIKDFYLDKGKLYLK